MSKAFGRLLHNPAVLARAPHLYALAEEPPPNRIVPDISIYQPKMFDNDELPVCCVANAINYAGWVAALNRVPFFPRTESVLSIYADVANCEDDYSVIKATSGTLMINAAQHLAVEGFDVGTQDVWGVPGVVATTRPGIANTISRFGAAFIGIDLYEEDMVTKLWKQKPLGQMVGRHALFAVAYEGLNDTDYVYLGTWGEWYTTVTWTWLCSRMQEAYALAFKNLSKPGGLEWTGSNYETQRQWCLATYSGGSIA